MGDLPPLTRACTRACSAFPTAREQQTRQHTCTRPRRVAGALQLLPEDGADKGRAMHDGVTPVQIAMHCGHADGFIVLASSLRYCNDQENVRHALTSSGLWWPRRGHQQFQIHTHFTTYFGALFWTLWSAK